MLRSVLLAALLLLAVRGFAQDDVAPGSGGPTPEAPIDGGASLLLASGAVYAVRRLRRRRA